jgi:LemA protein
MKIWIAILAVCVALAAGYGGVRIRNELVVLDVAVDTQWQQVENQLQRRHELVPKLVAVAQRYAAHEKDTLERLAASRAAYTSGDPGAKPRLAGELDGALVHVLALAESYPDLKADQQYRELAYEIAGTQNRIALERQRYNEVVGQRNARLRQFPWSMFRGDMAPRDFYEPPRDTLADPALGL